jgi:hypothetical protein
MDGAKRLIELVQESVAKSTSSLSIATVAASSKPTPDEEIIEVCNVLIQAGRVVFVRLIRGDDQMAACGQLGEPGDYQLPLLAHIEDRAVSMLFDLSKPKLASFGYVVKLSKASFFLVNQYKFYNLSNMTKHN